MTLRTSTARRAAAIVFLIAAAGIAILYITESGPFAGPVHNVLLISIDTTRADRLGCMGRGEGITPNIDALARDGIVFENAYAPVPETLPSHSTMLTGTNPVFHGVHRNENYRLGEFNETLAERLGEEGFTTAAIVSSFVLDEQFGLAQGFDTYDDELGEGQGAIGINERRGEEVTREALDWLSAHGDEPFFLFLHYFDPHMTYDPPEPFASRFAGEPYSGEIAYVDHCIGQVVALLEERGLLDSTIVIVTSDHGEMLGEHGELTHSYYVYQSAVWVPLLFRVPGHPGGVRLARLAGLIDIVPTVCGLLGIAPPAEARGVDLSASLDGALEEDREDGASRFILCESMTPTAFKANPLLGLISHDGWKYIFTTRPELYDLSADPSEQRNLVGAEPRKARMYREALEQIVAEQTRAGGEDEQVDLDPATRRRIESLGYVGGAARIDLEIDPDRDDPKDLIDYHRKASKVLAFVGARRYEEAEALCLELVGERPDLPGAWQLMGNFAMRKQDYAAAVEHSERVLGLLTDDTLALYRLGYAQRRLGEAETAKMAYTRLLRRDPDHALGLCDLGLMLLSEGDPAGAAVHLARAVKLDGENFLALRSLAWIRATHPDPSIRDADEALRLVGRAISLVPEPGATLLDTLAAAQAASGRFDQAVITAGQALRLVDDAADPDLASAIARRIELYRKKETFALDTPLPGDG